MDFLSSIMASLVLLSLALFLPVAYGQQLVPALFIFGDSVVDVGNNNNLPTLVKANFAPYGRDFVNHTATGRFSNGKIAIDFIAKRLLFTSYQPPYLNKSNATTRNLLIGANFASAASGYYEETANIFLAIPLSKQLEHYKEYQEEVVELVGAENASLIFSSGVHILSTGNSDFVQNYYINPVLNIALTSEQFSNILVQKYAQFIEELYGLGARKIGVTTLPPIGCLPAAITLFGFGQNQCIEHMNRDALAFNRRLNNTSQLLQIRLAGLTLIVFDIYQPLHDMITNPAQHGFSEVRRGCCGTGFFETSLFCNSLTLGTCNNASEYVFWDGFHPSEAANSILAEDMAEAGVPFLNSII